MARLRQRGGIGAGIAGAAGNINAMLQDQWSEAAKAKRATQLSQLQHFQELEKYRMENPNPKILDEITKNPETTSPELVRQSLMNASKAGAPNVPRQQNDQSQWQMKSETTAPAEGQISSRQISQTTPITQMIDSSLNTLKAQQGALQGKQARENNENPVYSESIGPNGETIKQSAPRGTPTTSTGATDQQAATRAGAIGAAQHAGNRDTPEDIATAASKAGAVANAENPALASRALAAAQAGETATAPRRNREQQDKQVAGDKKTALDQITLEESQVTDRMQNQMADLLKGIDKSNQPTRMAQIVAEHHKKLQELQARRAAVITGQPAPGNPSPVAPPDSPEAMAAPTKIRKYNPATGKLE